MKIEVRSKNLLHDQRARDRFEHVIDGIGDFRRIVCRLSNEVRELRVRFTRGVTRGTTDDLDYLGHGVAVAHSEDVLASDPVEAFLRHPECDDQVEVIAAFDMAETLKDLLAIRAIVDKIRDF